jgi:hypothetical protein
VSTITARNGTIDPRLSISEITANKDNSSNIINCDFLPRFRKFQSSKKTFKFIDFIILIILSASVERGCFQPESLGCRFE